MLEHLCLQPFARSIRCHPLLLWACALIVVALVTYFNLKGFHYGNNSFEMRGPGELYVSDVADDFSKLMCDGYRITSSAKMDVFLLPEAPELDPQNRNITTRQAADIFPGKRTPKNAFYLLEGSKIEVEACLGDGSDRTDVAVLFFKGDNSWNDWKSGSCDDCPLESENVVQKCNEGKFPIELNVDSRDTYYVTVTTGNNKEVTSLDVTTDVTVNATTFDTSKAVQTCINKKECFVDLDFSRDEAAIVNFVNASPGSVNTKCSLRTVAWVGLLVLLPFGIFLLGTGIYFLTCYRKESDEDTEAADKMGLVSDYSLRREYQTVSYDSKDSL